MIYRKSGQHDLLVPSGVKFYEAHERVQDREREGGELVTVKSSRCFSSCLTKTVRGVHSPGRGYKFSFPLSQQQGDVMSVWVKVKKKGRRSTPQPGDT